MKSLKLVRDETPSKQIVTRERIVALEAAMETHPGRIEIATTHHFSEGMYAREIFIPAGTLLTGKIHNFEHINIVSKGEILVVTEDGAKRLTAPCTFVARPGTKRVGYTITDTVWTTIHATTETDLKKLEKEIVRDSYNDAELLTDREMEILREGVICPG